MSVLLRPLSSIDPPGVEALLDAAFGPTRRARTAYRIRAGAEAIGHISWAATNADGAFIGSLQCWPVALTDPGGIAHPLTLVGPVAVDPAYQGQGVGRAMMTRLMEAANAGVGDTAAMVLIGDPDYYGRLFGFSAAPTSGWSVPGPVEAHRLLAWLRTPDVLPRQGALGPRPSALLAPAAFPA